MRRELVQKVPRVVAINPTHNPPQTTSIQQMYKQTHYHRKYRELQKQTKQLCKSAYNTYISTPDRVRYNCRAVKHPIGRPSGGISIGLKLYINWNAAEVYTNENIVCVKTDHVSIIACYFQPNTDILDIIGNISKAVEKLPPNQPLICTGDFNCRLDVGNRGYELTHSLYDAGLQCLNDPNAKTFVSSQGSSTIDLTFVSRGELSRVRSEVIPSLETKHQIVSTTFDVSCQNLCDRPRPIRRVDHVAMASNFDNETFSDALFSDNNVNKAFSLITVAVNESQVVKKT